VVLVPQARVMSEVRHVCSAGVGQWDYSTKKFRAAAAAATAAVVPVTTGSTGRGAAGDAARRQLQVRMAKRRSNAGGGGGKHSNMLHRNVSAPPKLPKVDTSGKHDHPGSGKIQCNDPAVARLFLSHPDHTNGMRNRQTRMLAGAVLDTRAVDNATDAELLNRALVSTSVKPVLAYSGLVTSRIEHPLVWLLLFTCISAIVCLRLNPPFPLLICIAFFVFCFFCFLVALLGSFLFPSRIVWLVCPHVWTRRRFWARVSASALSVHVMHVKMPAKRPWLNERGLSVACT
jgi:hypothetical protein